jgi:hypothetical protein
VGEYTVVSFAQDTSGNMASCAYSFAVIAARGAEDTSSGASSGAAIAGGAGGGIAMLALLALLVLFLMRRNYQRVRCCC